MTYAEYLQDVDSEEIDQLDEDISNLQTAIFRLQDVVNDSFEEVVKDCIKELEKHKKDLEYQKEKAEERVAKCNEHLQ